MYEIHPKLNIFISLKHLNSTSNFIITIILLITILYRLYIEYTTNIVWIDMLFINYEFRKDTTY